MGAARVRSADCVRFSYIGGKREKSRKPRSLTSTLVWSKVAAVRASLDSTTRCRNWVPALTGSGKSSEIILRRTEEGHQCGSTYGRCAPHSALWNNKNALVVRSFAATPARQDPQAIGATAYLHPL